MGSMQTQLGTLSRQSWKCQTLDHPSLWLGFIVAMSRQLLMLLSKSVCRDKVVECHDIYAAPISLAFFASLSQQCGLTILFGDYHDKFFNVVTVKPGEKFNFSEKW